MRERIINTYWKLRRYYWKYKFIIRKAMITSLEYASSIRLPYRKARSTLYWKAYGLSTAAYWKSRRGYDYSRVFFIRLFWKLKGVFDYIRGYSVGYFRHYTVIGYWKLRRLADFLKAEGAGSIANPFKKTYWFFSYQIQKRIFPIFRKKD